MLREQGRTRQIRRRGLNAEDTIGKRFAPARLGLRAFLAGLKTRHAEGRGGRRFPCFCPVEVSREKIAPSSAAAVLEQRGNSQSLLPEKPLRSL